MIEGVHDTALASDMITPATFDKGIEDLYRTKEEDGVFYFTLFKAVATKKGQ